ncbi:hypothetical protein [Aquibaculum sediminis]|uniref:hypothetical protein n=1 Tax=Aquibaculum sediminis TaxID=3231907 RepID=UPI0034545B28
MPELVGRITLVQEGRFRLVSAQGRVMLFLLSPQASLEPQDLVPLLQEDGPVTVHFHQRPGLIAGIAHDVAKVAP